MVEVFLRAIGPENIRDFAAGKDFRLEETEDINVLEKCTE